MATKKAPGARFLVLSRVGPADEWQGNAAITPAKTKQEADQAVERLLNVGAETVVIFQWDGENWVAIPH